MKKISGSKSKINKTQNQNIPTQNLFQKLKKENEEQIFMIRMMKKKLDQKENVNFLLLSHFY